MEHVHGKNSIIEINGNTETSETSWCINEKILTTNHLGNDFILPLVFRQGEKFTIKIPFCKPSEAILKTFRAISNQDEITEVTLTFELI